jgi:hypothetical protein
LKTTRFFLGSIASGITQADTAYWNRKLDNYTETDPIFDASVAKGISTQDTAYWNQKLDSYTETDPVFNASVAKGINSQDTAYWNKKLSSFIETDPLFNASIAKGINSQDTAYWNKKLSSFTENDPIFNASVAKRITAQDTLYWNNKLDFEKDSSITNELQTLSISNDTIFLSDGGKVRIPITIKNAHINQDSLYVTFSDNKVKNVGYVGNGSPGSVLATVSTDTVQQLKYATASVEGSIVHGGNELIVGRGICYATTPNPTLANFYQLSNDKTAIFIAHLSGLQPNTTYFARAFVTNTVGTAYGNSLSFKTLALTTPTLRTQGVFNVSHTTAMSNAVISDNGGSTILESGVCWSTSTNPTTASSKAISGTNADTFNAALSSLVPNTTYYVRTYAINAQGTSYSQQDTITTKNLALASLTTNGVSAVSFRTATSGGNVTSDNGSSVTVRGICWSTNTLPTITDSKVQQNAGVGSFSLEMTGLNPNTTYYVRAFATNGAGTAYGNQFSFTTLTLVVPTLTTKTVTGISSYLAGSGGDISSDGGSNISSKGVCWNINPNPTIANSKTNDGTGAASFSSTLTGLDSLTTYYVRAYATNSTGTSYGNEVSFKTTGQVNAPPSVPTLGTKTAAMLTSSKATSGGYVSSNGGSAITAVGLCWSTNQNPTIANSKTTKFGTIGHYLDTLSGLTGCGIVYYIRAYATNSTGTAYGNQVTVTTGVGGTVATYDTLQVGFYTAKLGGVISDSGNCPIIQKGICWNWTSNPTTANFKTENGKWAHSFEANVTGLMANRTYYYRAYATTSVGTFYGPEKTFVTKTPIGLYIGKSYAGGIIFYLDSTGQHGLVCAPTSQGYAEWGCSGTNINGTSSAIGSGAINTAAILAGCSTNGIAAKICDDLVLNGYSDWYLPSSGDLNEIRVKLGIVGLIPISEAWWDGYWSSTNTSSNNAISIYFYNQTNNDKGNWIQVLPVRSF